MRAYPRTVFVLVIASILLSAAAAIAAGQSLSEKLVGAWKLTSPALDAGGQPCPFVPDSIEFFSDQTVAMANMPGGQMPFKTDLTAEEKQAVLARNPGLKGMGIMLMKPAPQMDWRSTPMVYGYTVSQKQLTLTVPGYSAAKFKRMK